MHLYVRRSDKFDKEEMEWAISLIEREYDKKDRQTPEQMAALIAKDFDVKCDPIDVYSFFGLKENYELESMKEEYYGRDYIESEVA